MLSRFVSLFVLTSALIAKAAPVITPVPTNVFVPAGKSLIIPITATVTNGRPLTYTITGTTNRIAIISHTNNPFWKLHIAQACASNAPGAFQTPYRGGLVAVTNVGDMTFMLFPEYAPQTVSIIQGLSASGFYNSNTIFHFIQTNFVIQGGDPLTNNQGGLVFQYPDEYHPQAVFSGNGQLALASNGKDNNGSQFFITVGQQRGLDFRYTLFGQLVRGFDVLSNINFTATTNNRPLRDVIITQAGVVPDTSDIVLTLTATNRAKMTNTITVVASDGVGGLATNIFKAISITDSNSNSQPFLYGNPVTNLVATATKTLTNIFSAVELDGDVLYWFPFFADAKSQTNSVVSGNYLRNIYRTLTYNVTNFQGQLQFFCKATNNYVGPITIYLFVSPYSNWNVFYQLGYGDQYAHDQIICTFVFGDTDIKGQPVAVAPQNLGPITNLLLATFTNGVVSSAISNFTASIQWGDDSISSGVITTNVAKQKQVFGSHTYTNAGNYSVYVTIQSYLGVTTVVSNSISVIPNVTLARNGANNVIGWPGWAADYVVQSNTNLAGTNWVTITNASAVLGFQNAISNPATASPVFYRLKK